MLVALLFLQAAAPPLELACGGGGIAIREDVATVYGAQNTGNSAWPSVHAREATRFEAPIDIRLSGETARIRLPAAMLPAETGGDGWFALGRLNTTDQSITGVATVNAMSRPQVHIDRGTGTIRIRARSASYSGTCASIGS